MTEQAIDLFKHFYPLSRIQHDLHADILEKGKDATPSTSHPFKDQIDLDRAAQRFAENIMNKSIKVSIATMQGFLLLYKKDPVMALEKVDAWAEGIRREQFPDTEMPAEKQSAGVQESERGEIGMEQAGSEIDEKKSEEHDAEIHEASVETREKQVAVQEVILA